MISHEIVQGSGAIRVFSMVKDRYGDEFLQQRICIGYTLAQAIEIFREDMKGLGYEIPFDETLADGVSDCECDSGMNKCYWHWDETGEDDE